MHTDDAFLGYAFLLVLGVIGLVVGVTFLVIKRRASRYIHQQRVEERKSSTSAWNM